MNLIKLLRRAFISILFIIVLTYVFEIDISEIFNITELIMLIFGSVLFCIADYENCLRDKRLYLPAIGKNVFFTGCFESLILIMGNIEATVFEIRVMEISYYIRPFFYGFIIWVIFKDSRDKANVGEAGKKDVEPQIKSPAIEDYYRAFRERGLTNRETEIAIMAVQGHTNAEIAYEFSIAETTVKKHMSNIFEKLDISSRENLKKIF